MKTAPATATIATAMSITSRTRRSRHFPLLDAAARELGESIL
jgi:hypothetical protein